MAHSKKRAAEQPLIAKQLGIKITREYTSKRVYSNFVHVSRSPLDMSLIFCDIQSVIIGEGKQPPTHVDAPVQIEVVIPITLLDALISALKGAQDMEKITSEPTKE